MLMDGNIPTTYTTKESKGGFGHFRAADRCPVAHKITQSPLVEFGM